MTPETVMMVSMQEFDDLVEKTYKRPYTFQQQDGCKDRGIARIDVPVKHPYDYENTTIPEEVNGNEMGVSFAAWLARDPKQKLDTTDEWDRKNGLELFWDRNFYPNIDMVVNDLHAKGLLEAGEYVIEIDW